MAHTTMHRALRGQRSTCPQRVGRNVQRCCRLNVVAKAAGPPPAWDKRVVVPEVQPRDTPKVRGGPASHVHAYSWFPGSCSYSSSQHIVTCPRSFVQSLDGEPTAVAAHLAQLFVKAGRLDLSVCNVSGVSASSTVLCSIMVVLAHPPKSA